MQFKSLFLASALSALAVSAPTLAEPTSPNTLLPRGEIGAVLQFGENIGALTETGRDGCGNVNGSGNQARFQQGFNCIFFL